MNITTKDIENYERELTVEFDAEELAEELSDVFAPEQATVRATHIVSATTRTVESKFLKPNLLFCFIIHLYIM